MEHTEIKVVSGQNYFIQIELITHLLVEINVANSKDLPKIHAMAILNAMEDINPIIPLKSLF